MNKTFMLYLILMILSMLVVSLLLIHMIETSGQITDKLSIIDNEAHYIVTTEHTIYYTDKETFDKIEIGKTYKIRAQILELE